MSRGEAKARANLAKARKDRVIKAKIGLAAPAEVKDGKAAIERKIEDKKPKELQRRNYKR